MATSNGSHLPGSRLGDVYIGGLGVGIKRGLCVTLTTSSLILVHLSYFCTFHICAVLVPLIPIPHSSLSPAMYYFGSMHVGIFYAFPTAFPSFSFWLWWRVVCHKSFAARQSGFLLVFPRFAFSTRFSPCQALPQPKHGFIVMATS